MNAALQILCHTPDIRDYFLDGQYSSLKNEYNLNWDISDELYEIISKLWTQSNSFKPKRFKNKAREYIQLLDNKDQQDSADFLIQLLELIHNELTG